MLLPPDDFPEDFELPDIGAILEGATSQARREHSDRYHAIVAAVDLEEALGSLLANFMIESKLSRDLLRTTFHNFVTRINVAFCLGLISQDELGVAKR